MSVSIAQFQNPMTSCATALARSVQETPGLMGVLVTDKDGVPILYSFNEQLGEFADAILEGIMSATFSVACEQLEKLGIGGVKCISSFYGNYTILHYNTIPTLVLSLICDSKSESVACSRALVPSIASMLEELGPRIHEE